MGKRELLWALLMPVNTQQQLLQYPLPHTLWKVAGGGHQRRQGTAEGLRVMVGLKQCSAAPQSWTVPPTLPHSSSAMLGKISHGWSWHGHPLLSGCLTYPPVPECSLRPRRVIFNVNWIPHPICRPGPQTVFSVCVVEDWFAAGQGWEGRGPGDSGASYWSWHCSQSPWMVEPQPTCKRDWTLATASGFCALHIKCCSMLETVKWFYDSVKTQVLAIQSGMQNLLTLHFQQVACHWRNT